MYICRPLPPCGESTTTLRLSGLNRGVVSQRHTPLYSGLETKRRRFISNSLYTETRTPVIHWPDDEHPKRIHHQRRSLGRRTAGTPRLGNSTRQGSAEYSAVVPGSTPF